MFAWSRESLSPRGFLRNSLAAVEGARERVRAAELGREGIRMRRIDGTRVGRAGGREERVEEEGDLGGAKGFDEDAVGGER